MSGQPENNGAVEDAEQLEFQAGRRAPYSQVGDWVALAPVDLVKHPAARLYWLLSAHINASRDDTVVWPTQDALAEMLGYSDGRKIVPYLRQLEAINAIETKVVPFKRGKRSAYLVHQSPPEGYEGLESLKDFYTARKARIAAAQKAERDAKQVQLTFEAEPGTADFETPGQGEGAETSTFQGEVPKRAPSEGGEGAETSTLGRCRNEHPNKNKKNQTKLEQDQRGGTAAARLPRTPSADLTGGHFETVVTTQPGFSTELQTACAETGVGESDSQAGAEIPVREAVMAEVRAKFPDKVRSRVRRAPKTAHCPSGPPNPDPATTPRL